MIEGLRHSEITRVHDVIAPVHPSHAGAARERPRRRPRAISAHAQAGIHAAWRLVQGARRLRQSADPIDAASGRGRGVRRQSRRSRGLRGDAARHSREDLRADGVVTGQDRPDSRLRRRRRRHRRSLCRRARGQRAVRGGVAGDADPRVTTRSRRCSDKGRWHASSPSRCRMRPRCWWRSAAAD